LGEDFEVFGFCRSVAKKYISICIHTNVVIYESWIFLVKVLRIRVF
jgi:hypothetical protein